MNMGCHFTRCCGIRVVVGLAHCLMLVACMFVVWVKTDEAVWTLWGICISNFSAPNPKNYELENLTDQRCGDLDSGDVGVPDFYHAIRALVFILIAFCCLQLFVCMDNQCLDQGKRPALMTFMSAVLGIIIVAVAFASAPQEEGEFFQGENLELSLGAVLIIVSTCLSSALVYANLKYDEHRTREAKKKKSQDERRLHQPRAGRFELESERTDTGGGDHKVEKNREGAASSLPKKNSVGPAPPSTTVSGSINPQGEERPRTTKKKKKRRRNRNPHEDPHYTFNSGGVTALASTSSFADSYQTHNRGEKEEEVPMDSRLYSRINSGGFTTSTSVVDQTHNKEDEEVVPIDSRLYFEDLRSASRASVLHNQEMREKSQGQRGGETPLLDAMPVYTLPPSGDRQTPSRPPPSYESATTGEYGLDMPAPPVVTVPISFLSSRQGNGSSMNTKVGQYEY